MPDSKPRYIYKYMPDRLDRIGNIVVNRRIFFSSPLKFNDPFDCAIGIRFPDPNNLTKEDEACWRWYFEHIAAMRGDSNTVNKSKRDAAHTFELGKHKDPSFISDTQREIDRVIQEGGKQLGVFCASETMESAAMWAHYAANHRGVVIEFDHTTLVDLQGNIRSFRVEYQDLLPSLCDYREMIQLKDPVWFERLFFCRKSSEWKNEKEWRFFTTPTDSFMDLPDCSITRVIFGAKMPEGNKDLIQKWVQGSPDKIQLSDAFPSNAEFKIIARDRTSKNQ
jgi:hypothetical protein